MFNEEMIKKIRGLGSPEELIELGKENGFAISKETAEKYFNSLHGSGEISDEELENTAGGCGGGYSPSIYKQCPECGTNIAMKDFHDVKVIVSDEVLHQWGYPTGVCPKCNVRYAYVRALNMLYPVSVDEKGTWVIRPPHRY